MCSTIMWCIDIKVGKPTVLGATGLIAGLVAITPAAGFADVPAAIIIGLGASLVSYCIPLKKDLDTMMH